MEINGQELSYIQEQYLTDPEFVKEMAAAHLTMKVAGLLEKAISASETSEEELAEKLHAPISRVEELLAAEGNIKISSLARMLSAMGFALKLELLTETIDEYGNVHHIAFPYAKTSRR